MRDESEFEQRCGGIVATSLIMRYIYARAVPEGRKYSAPTLKSQPSPLKLILKSEPLRSKYLKLKQTIGLMDLAFVEM
jgi:hypothetical protein